MFANPDKFQTIVAHHNQSIDEKYTLKVNNVEIQSENFGKSLGI